MYKHRFSELVDEIQEFNDVVVADAHLSASHLRQVLSFIVKVSQVVEQAFQDVITVLIEVKYLSEDDIYSSKIIDLQKQIDFLTMRSKYRDAEEICSRLHHLANYFYESLAPFLNGIVDANSWTGIWGLLNEHEGRLINLVHQISRQLQDSIISLDKESLPKIKHFAGEQLQATRIGLNNLRNLSEGILGASGKLGLLELIATDGNVNASASFFKGDFVMNKQNYKQGDNSKIGVAGNANNVHDIDFSQTWNNSSKDIDISQLSAELTKLRADLASKASEPEHYIALGEIAAAEKAAKEGDGAKTMEHLKSAGNWVWDTISKVGIGVATAAAKTALGI